MTERQFAELLRIADENICINTSYPLEPSWFLSYRTQEDLFWGVQGLSYYIHVPFCRSLCKYCEYTRFQAGNESVESHYVDLLEKQCEEFLSAHRVDMIRGCDIGGGTPTALSLPNFRRILSLVGSLTKGVARDERFLGSLEFSFDTITEEKVKEIADAGFLRASAGIQAIGKWFDLAYDRNVTQVERVCRVHDWLRSAGVDKLNLDLMYGFPGQTVRDIGEVMDFVSKIIPEQITLYEMRYNQSGISPVGVTRDGNYAQYVACYIRLMEMGYCGRFGANAFSRGGEKPFSSYIESRMDDAYPYKGFGASAQSMTDQGLSYNTLKGCKSLALPWADQISEADVYLLPRHELVAKYVSVALYGGSFNLHTLSRLMGDSYENHFAHELAFLVDQGFAHIDEERVLLTENGVRHGSAISVLFWPEHRRKALMNGGARTMWLQ